jgi:hypothetical protein
VLQRVEVNTKEEKEGEKKEVTIKNDHMMGYTNVLKIDLKIVMKCPEKYIKAYIFFNYPTD